MKPSKGPWYKHPKQKVNLRGSCFHYRHDITGSEFAEPIASLYGNDIAEANANLIAAAPEMLEALKDICELSADAQMNETEKNYALRRIQNYANKAIKKARGES